MEINNLDQSNSIKNNQVEQIVGRAIRSPKVLCIDSEGKNLGVISTYDAIRLAEDNGLDLVQMNFGAKGSYPTCKIMNYGKFKYETTKKQKEAAKKQRQAEVKTKEIKFRPNTSTNDLQIKAKHAEDFLNEGHRVKVSLVCKGREMSHQDIAYDTFQIFLEMLSNITILNNPSFEGKEMSALICKKAEL